MTAKLQNKLKEARKVEKELKNKRNMARTHQRRGELRDRPSAMDTLTVNKQQRPPEQSDTIGHIERKQA